MHPNSFLARAHAHPVAFASSSSSPSNLAFLLPPGEMPPPYDDCASPSPSTSPKASAATQPAAQSPMALPLPLSTRRGAPSPPNPLVTPPPYCASPPLVPVESRSPDLAVDELKHAPGRPGRAGEVGDDEEGEGEEKYLALATPAQRSYFVTLSDLFEGAAVQSKERTSADGGEEKEALSKAGWLRGRQEEQGASISLSLAHSTSPGR